VLGVWLHIYQDSIIYTYLLKDGSGNSSTSHSNSNSNSNNAGGTGGGGAGSSRSTEAVISLETIPFVLMGVGGFLASMSFLGCCGACAESVCFLGFVSA